MHRDCSQKTKHVDQKYDCSPLLLKVFLVAKDATLIREIDRLKIGRTDIAGLLICEKLAKRAWSIQEFLRERTPHHRRNTGRYESRTTEFPAARAVYKALSTTKIGRPLIIETVGLNICERRRRAFRCKYDTIDKREHHLRTPTIKRSGDANDEDTFCSFSPFAASCFPAC